MHLIQQTQIPLLAKKYQQIEDPNKRTSTGLKRTERNLPFFSGHEEFETLNSVLREEATALTESLKFFEGKWHKLTLIDYQKAFEWMLWKENGILLETLFENHTSVLSQGIRPLIFNWIEKGYQYLLPLERKEGGIGFLFHIHLRLCQLSIQHHTGDAQQRIVGLFQRWEGLIERGKKNGFLAKALSEGVFAALPTMANVQTVIMDLRLIHLVATTLLLECYQEEVLPTKYDPLTLTYGYHVFKELLRRFSAEEIWKNATQMVFDVEKTVLWEDMADVLTVENQRFYLALRTIEGGSGKKMSYVPMDWAKNSDYSSLFGDKPLLATPFREGEKTGFWITHHKKDYTIYCTGKEQIQIFRKIEGELCQFSTTSLQLNADHAFMKKHVFWTGTQTCFKIHSNNPIPLASRSPILLRLPNFNNSPNHVFSGQNDQSPIKISNWH